MTTRSLAWEPAASTATAAPAATPRNAGAAPPGEAVTRAALRQVRRRIPLSTIAGGRAVLKSGGIDRPASRAAAAGGIVRGVRSQPRGGGGAGKEGGRKPM